MFYYKFTKLIEDNAELLSHEWIKAVKNNPSTERYKNIPDDTLHTRIMVDLKNIDSFLNPNEQTLKKIATHYLELGRKRAGEGLKESEVIYALILLRVIIWSYVKEQSVFDNAIALNYALDFYKMLNNFIDKSIYFVAVGYESLSPDEQQKLEHQDFIDKAVSAVTEWIIKK